MKRKVQVKGVVLLRAVALLASTAAALDVLPAAAGEDSPAGACLKLQPRPAVFATLGCTKFLSLWNSCDLPVIVEVRSTQRLLSGTLTESIQVVLPARGERSLGCAWWSSALAPTQHELLGARYAGEAPRPSSREGDGSGRR